MKLREKFSQLRLQKSCVGRSSNSSSGEQSSMVSRCYAFCSAGTTVSILVIFPLRRKTDHKLYPKNLKMADQAKKTQQSHFVLVHGACHGAWCWYKLKPLLESSGHWVTIFDLLGSGIHPKPIQAGPTFYDYTEPLLNFMASLPEDEKVILVGHSLGGLNLALAMENFPHKVSVAVFLTAFMPDTVNHPSFVVEKATESVGDAWLDTQLSSPEDPQNQQRTMLFGPKFLSSTLYQNSPIEDLELAKVLLRPSSMYLHDLSKARKFTDKKYGSVTRVYVVCDEDKAIPLHFQQWMISNNPTRGVIEIKGADHMAMFSKPQQLCQSLNEIDIKYV